MSWTSVASSAVARKIAARVCYAICCVLAVVVLLSSGAAYFAYQNLSAIGGSHAIVSGPSIGEQNILLMGLESRRDWNGNVLPNDILKALHAGNRQGILNGVGGNTTNTLILLHVFNGGSKAVGFSIPRDDWVTYPQPYDGQPAGKIDQAYGLAMAAKEDQLRAGGARLSSDQIAFAGNEAGRAAAVSTVEAVTGVHIDHFAELNLDGFYELAKALSGVEICLKHPVAKDANSGFYGHAGYQFLNAKDALAFVRQRDNLPQGDLDRTHRQQAVLDYVLWKVEHQGILSDFSQMSAMLSMARQYLIADAGWNLVDFASQMRSLTGRNLRFHTLPVVTTDGHIAGQDVNIINTGYIQQVVHQTFYPTPAGPAGSSPRQQTATATPPSATTVSVYNGGYTAGLAGQVMTGLQHAGFRKGKVGNGTAHPAITQVLYGGGESANAARIASLFGVTAQPAATVPAGNVKLVLGTGATLPDFTGLSTAGAPSPAASSAASSSAGLPASAGPPSPAASVDDGQAGGAVTVRPNAPFGIPCVA